MNIAIIYGLMKYIPKSELWIKELVTGSSSHGGWSSGLLF
jgi:hypothetical protein